MNPYLFYNNNNNNNNYYDYTDLIFLNKNDIIQMKEHQIIFGRFYLKEKKNKFFKRWNNKYFFLKNNILHIWKKKNNVNSQHKKLYLNSHFGISGIQYNDKEKYITFYIYYLKYKTKTKTKMKKLLFKSYNIKNIILLYNSIEKIIYEKK